MYTVGIGLGVIIYIPNFVKISSGFSKLLGGYTYKLTDTQAAR
jgi:hypothetical protein